MSITTKNKIGYILAIDAINISVGGAIKRIFYLVKFLKDQDFVSILYVYATLESMSCASAIVCSDFDFDREFAKDSALYLNVNDVDSLVNSVLSLILDKKLKMSIAQKAYSYAAEFD